MHHGDLFRETTQSGCNSPRTIESPECAGSPSAGSADTSTSGYWARSTLAGIVKRPKEPSRNPMLTRPDASALSSQTSRRPVPGGFGASRSTTTARRPSAACSTRTDPLAVHPGRASRAPSATTCSGGGPAVLATPMAMPPIMPAAAANGTQRRRDSRRTGAGSTDDSAVGSAAAGSATGEAGAWGGAAASVASEVFVKGGVVCAPRCSARVRPGCLPRRPQAG